MPDNNPILAANINFQNVTLLRYIAVRDDKAVLKALQVPQPPAPETGAASGLQGSLDGDLFRHYDPVINQTLFIAFG